MNFNKQERGPQNIHKKNKFEEIIENLNVVLDLLSDADFRKKFPEFVNKYQITIEQAEKIRSLGSTELGTGSTLREYLESLLEEAQNVRLDIPPADRNRIDFIIKIIEHSLNALNN